MVVSSGGSINASGLFNGNIAGDYLVNAAVGTKRDTAIVHVIPPPALTRIAITPDTATVPLRASQQFIAKGYDQHDNPYTFKPGWSVTGSGNTIDTNGIFTAGATPGTFTVTASGNTISGTSTVTVAYYTCTVNNKYEAESAVGRSPGLVLETCTDTDGGEDFTNLKAGSWFTYDSLNIPVAGRYNISFRVLSTAPSKIWLGHSTYKFDTISVPSTGGIWMTITDTIRLPALNYTGVHILSGTLKFNWFSIDNCAVNELSARMAYSKVEPHTETIDPVIYPNPTNGRLTIDLRGLSCKRLTLSDIRGNVLRQWNIPNGEKQISRDISTLPAGIYILTLKGENQTKTFQIVKI
jgi:hypothetical protein